MKKLLTLITIGLFCASTQAQTIYPTIPGTSIRDYGSNSPGYSQFGNTLHPTIPGTGIRDYGSNYPSYGFDY